MRIGNRTAHSFVEPSMSRPARPEFHHDESNRFGMCSFVSRRGFEFFRRNGAICPRKNRRCDEESAVRARRDADAADGSAKKPIHQAMSGQQRTAGRGCRSSTGRSAGRPNSSAEDRAVRPRQSAQHLHGQHRTQQCANRAQLAGGRFYRHVNYWVQCYVHKRLQRALDRHVGSGPERGFHSRFKWRTGIARLVAASATAVSPHTIVREFSSCCSR
jgi:hypothetical protein